MLRASPVLWNDKSQKRSCGAFKAFLQCKRCFFSTVVCWYLLVVVLACIVALASVTTVYFQRQLGLLADRATDLAERSKHSAAEVLALHSRIKELERERDEHQLKAVTAERLKAQQEESCAAEAGQQRQAVAELTNQLTQRQEELERERGRLSEVDQRLQNSDNDLHSCEEENVALLLELNRSRAEAEDARSSFDKAARCCDSVPMCNLCRIRSEN